MASAGPARHAREPERARRDWTKDRLLADAGTDLRATATSVLRHHGQERLTACLVELWFTARADLNWEATERPPSALLPDVTG